MAKYLKALEKYLRDLGYDPGELIDPSRPPAKAYKLFRQREGELYPLFVNADQPVPMGQWLEADVGPLTAGGKVKSKIGDLAYRPGWHAGDLPIATHIGGKAPERGRIPTKPNYRPDEQVWAEIEMPGAVDWQRVALDRADRSKAGNIIPRTAHITDRLPTGGFYRYKTNPNMTGEWLIGGEMRVNRLLEDAEVRDINRAAGVEDLPRLRNLQRRKGYVPAAAGAGIGLGALADSEEAEAMPIYRAFRGEHGLIDAAEEALGGFQSRHGALSFSDMPGDANIYAMDPNMRGDVAVQPRVYQADVTIDNPVVNTPDDPFMEFSDLEDAIGFERARKYFEDYEEWVQDTAPWYEGDFSGSLKNLTDDEMRQQYMMGYPLINDPELVAELRDAGYDGAILAGFGQGVGTEVRPFSASQATSAWGAPGEGVLYSRGGSRLGDEGRMPNWTPAAGLGAAVAATEGQAAMEDPDVDEILYNAQARPWEGSYDRYIADTLWDVPEPAFDFRRDMPLTARAWDTVTDNLELLDVPLQGLLGLATLAGGQGLDAAVRNTQRPPDETLFDFGAWVTDIAAQNPKTRAVAPALGTAAYIAPMWMSPF